MKKKKSHGTTVLLLLILFAGLSLLLYPSIADYWNSFTQSQVITGYTENISQMNDEEYDALLEQAVEYNASLLGRANSYLLSEEQIEEYDQLLNVSGTGVMGYIEIPSIACSLPVYHGTSDAVLQVAVGHIEWSSLPVGGENSHCVLSGHRGLPSAKLFTDLDRVVEGDVFMLRVLNEVYTYQVDQILIVNPDETSSLLIEPGQDLCTLVTCTPYGINTHRLLVRGHRIDTVEKKIIHLTSDAVVIEPLIVAPILAIPVLLALLIWLSLPRRPAYKREGDEQ